MKYNTKLIIAFISVIVFGVPWLINNFPKSTYYIDNAFSFVDSNLAAVFFRESITVSQLHNKYDLADRGKTKVRILIVPGHEPDFGGTEYMDLKEREMTVELAKYLQLFFQNNSHYEVVLARDNKKWNPDLQEYFDKNWKDIIDFFKKSKGEMLHYVNNGTVTKLVNGVQHNAAPQNVALRLYGINKWVNENNIDLTIHIHFNDYPRNDPTNPGEYSGFAIYVPEKQYSNSTTTRVIADTVFKRLEKYNAVSNLPKEKSGVIEEQDLIAIGSYNTLDAPSMLIEYGYIYEPQFAEKKLRQAIFKDLAFQTYLGVQDFFDTSNNSSITFDTLMLPYSWKGELSKDKADKSDVLALQTALSLEGVYPVPGKTKNDCPRTGRFGPCTSEALGIFQKKYGIVGEKERVGEKTKKVLNNLYSVTAQ